MIKSHHAKWLALLSGMDIGHECSLNVVSSNFAPNCRLNTVEVGHALKDLLGPLIMVGDFNDHSQS
jgi:hypothetical protein